MHILSTTEEKHKQFEASHRLSTYNYLSHTAGMSLDNANPTVHRLAATSATAELLDPLTASSWLQTKPGGSSSDSDSEEDEEPIDADEIYGRWISLCARLKLANKMSFLLVQI